MTEEAELLRRLEERLFDPVVRRSPKDVETLLAEQFLEFGRSGRVYDKRQIIELMRDEPSADRALSDFEARPLAPGVVLVTYRSTARRGASRRRGACAAPSGHWSTAAGA